MVLGERAEVPVLVRPVLRVQTLQFARPGGDRSGLWEETKDGTTGKGGNHCGQLGDTLPQPPAALSCFVVNQVCRKLSWKHGFSVSEANTMIG